MTMTENSLPCSDVVIVFRNRLRFVRPCLQGLRQHTRAPYKLWLINDESDSHAAAEVREILSGFPEGSAEMVANPDGLGSLGSVNRGIDLGREKYIVLLNSDTVPTPGWLAKLVELAERHPDIAILNVLSNRAKWTRIQMPPGWNFLDFGKLVESCIPNEAEDVNLASSFCTLIRRSLIEEVGALDECYSRGYWEEADLSMRALEAGHRVAVAKNTYIFHHGCDDRGEDGRNEPMERDRDVFLGRWAEKYLPAEERLERWEHLTAPQELARKHTIRPPRMFVPWALEGLEKHGVIGSCHWAVRKLLQQLLRLPPDFVGDVLLGRPSYREGRFWHNRVLARERRVVSARRARPALPAPPAKPKKPSVTYLVSGLALYGGNISIVSLVNELVLRGMDARVAVYGGVDPRFLRAYPLYSTPLLAKTRAALIAQLPPSDILVATHWRTAEAVHMLATLWPRTKTAYFIQDYEAWFHPESDPIRSEVLATYEWIPNRIVKSDWLVQRLAAHNAPAVKIPLGLNLDVFYPRRTERPDRLRLLTTVRQKNPRRGFEHMVAVLPRIIADFPGVEIVLLGEYIDEDVPFAHERLGQLFDPDEIAELYSSCDLFVDFSHFQGFGRPGLEAMACETACVLTNVGGVNEYARDGDNCLLVPPKDAPSACQAIARLIDDPGLRRRLAQRGVATAQRFCHRLEGERSYNYFMSLLGSDRGAPEMGEDEQ